MRTGSTTMSNNITKSDVDPNVSTPFQSLQSTFNATRRARPPTMSIFTENETEERVPLKLQRQLSKAGLRGIFKRNKVEKSGISSVQEEDRVTSATSERSMQEMAAKTLPQSPSTIRSSTVLENLPITPQKHGSKTSQMHFRSANQTKPGTKAGSKSSPKSSTKTPTRTSAAWDPPPLFQAYPQAIKHAQLSASALSADAILRISRNKKGPGLIREEFAQTIGDQDQTAAAKKTEKAKSKHRRHISGSITGAGWTQKVYVLVTSGYLLQYSGDGSFDRLPEKMMQLGKDSVAFASDAIPGKHWVLQISQAMNADGAPSADSRSLFSRLSFRGVDYRRTTTSMLLVLNSAEEMDSWLAIVRREIEALGGKKHVSETGKPKPNDNVMQLRAQPSHRYLVSRTFDQTSSPSSPSTSYFAVPDRGLQGKDESSALSRPQSFSQPLTSHGSNTNSIVSHDGRQLDGLRDSTYRLSYMSSGTRESTSTMDEFPTKISTEDTRSIRPNAYAISERRRSIQTLQIAIIDAKPYRPHSTLAVPPRPTHPLSPPVTPNFSIPFPSPNRFTTQQNIVNEVPPIQSLATSTPIKATIRGDRKSPPTALNISRSLSPVDDLSFVDNSPTDVLPTNNSVERIPQAASIMDVSPQLSQPTVHLETRLPRRTTSLMALDSSDTSFVNFQFPRRHSSIHDLRDAVDGLLRSRTTSPISQTALETPLPPSPTPSTLRGLQNVENKEKEDLFPLPDSINGHKVYRPASMQIHTTLSHASIFKSPTISNKRPSSSLGLSKTPRSMAKAPSVQRPKATDSSKPLGNRRSMPLLSPGPPPAPPPTAALPPLPPASGGLKSPMRVGVSVKV